DREEEVGIAVPAGGEPSPVVGVPFDRPVPCEGHDASSGRVSGDLVIQFTCSLPEYQRGAPGLTVSLAWHAKRLQHVLGEPRRLGAARPARPPNPAAGRNDLS